MINRSKRPIILGFHLGILKIKYIFADPKREFERIKMKRSADYKMESKILKPVSGLKLSFISLKLMNSTLKMTYSTLKLMYSTLKLTNSTLNLSNSTLNLSDSTLNLSDLSLNLTNLRPQKYAISMNIMLLALAPILNSKIK